MSKIYFDMNTEYTQAPSLVKGAFLKLSLAWQQSKGLARIASCAATATIAAWL